MPSLRQYLTRIRLQVGWQEEHPIEVACGKCGTSLSGSVKIGQEHPGLSFSFDNADDVQDAVSDSISCVRKAENMSFIKETILECMDEVTKDYKKRK
ncbi:MAG: hypothetical protein SOU06_08490 [Bulleidia sp.]|nr:hypothetical protein [Bulleidia sp.]